jgi:predicted nucleic acid-binding protein
MAVRAKILDLPEALHRLDLVRTLGIRSHTISSLWEGALVRACVSGVSAYDTLFVELAAREGLPLATFDKALLKGFPAVAHRPAAIVQA